jgi:hydroxyacylglutathione hydrolase
MKQLYDDLWQTKLEIPFGSVHTHAYLLQCEKGNALIYNTRNQEEIQHIAALGGIKYQYLSHRDEAGESLKGIKDKFGSELCCHVEEEAAIALSCPVDITFSEDVAHFSGIEIIHTPGHTIGSISFLYHSPLGRTYLFTGDTLFQSDGTWGTLVFSGAGGSTKALIASLSLYRELSPDVIIWSASGGGETTFVEPTKDEWLGIIDNTIEKLSN